MQQGEPPIASIGLQGIWGLEQLDRPGISSLKLLILLVMLSDAIGLLLAMLVGPVDQDSIFAPYYTERVISLTVLGMSGSIGLTIALNILLARTTEADMRALSAKGGMDDCVQLLKPKLSIFLPIVTAITLFTALASPILATQRLEISVLDSIRAFILAGAPLQIMLFVLWPLVGIAWGIGFAIGVTQIIGLTKVAKTIQIDLFQLPDYAKLASPTIRVIIIVLVMSSIMPVFMFLVDDPVITAQVTKLTVAVWLIVLPALAAWWYPILILRNRIKLKKTEELSALLLAIQGDDSALNNSCIPRRGQEISTADLLTHQMFIESRWEWPIASHVQKLVLFGLLPPLTWVLAAMIENALY